MHQRRVVILSQSDYRLQPRPRYRWASQDAALIDRVADMVAGVAEEERALDPDSEKPGLIVRLMRILTGHYRIPECLEPWAIALARRENLYETGFSDCFAFPHQFQAGEPLELRTDNDRVDWWLVLFPQGIDCWNRFQEKPVHAMVMFVVSRPVEMVGYFITCLKPLAGGMAVMCRQDPHGWKTVSQMDRVSAARFLNRYIVGAMQGEDRR